MMYALDIETACTVPDCQWHGEAMCKNQHSLSPWHSRITVIGVVSSMGDKVFRGPNMIAELNRWLAGLPSDAELTMHNGKFDVLHLIQKGADAEMLTRLWKHDTFLSAFVWTEKVPPEYLEWYAANSPKDQRAASQHSLKTLAPYFLKVAPFWEVADKNNDEYVLTDTRHTLALTEFLNQNMPEDQQEFAETKLLLWTKMLVEAELRGLKLDVEGLLLHKAELEKEEQKLKAQLDTIWAPAHAAYSDRLRAEVNRKYDNQKQTKSTESRRISAMEKVADKVSYDSPTQMKWLLGEYLNYDIRSLEGDESTGKEVLIRLAEEGHDDVAIFLKWRKVQKVLTAFIPKMLELRDADDVIHPIYNPTGARTGRTSSERPNAQQVPSALKKFFKPREGKLIGYDQAAIEAKLIAAYTEDPSLMEIIQSGDSIHNANTIAFFDLECAPNEVPTKFARHRKAAKNVGFALFYFAAANRIRIALTQGGFPVTITEAKRMHKAFLSKFSTAISYAKEVVDVFENGGSLPNLLGRPIKIQNPQDAYMQGFNTLIQSSASDINLDRMHSALSALRAEGITAFPLLTVHDYAGIEVVGNDDVVSRADTIVRRALVDLRLTSSLGSINLEIDGGVTSEWR